eukprot:TRINITY_DN16301_c0_g1_i1.p1 TRINITY_DN16301_c0_g1~~TRINITY_DN16301_c0_g1_i1.p1  ORF type:complete len:524 (-),score=86.63 TRINITY_DN16301_c0_g1_i1:312-1763(-)
MHLVSFLLCGVAIGRAARCYMSTGGHCPAKRWGRQRVLLRQLANSSSAPLPQEGLATIPFFAECPEGASSWLLAYYAREPARRNYVLGVFKDTLSRHFNTKLLMGCVRHGGWPDFGVGEAVEADLVRARFPEAADLLLDTTPRFQMSTPPASPQILQGWWWPKETVALKSMTVGAGDKGSSIDFGMQVVFLRTALLRERRGLLLIDVGAFDGTSLLASALKADMNHSVLAFEPLWPNRETIAYEMTRLGLQRSVQVLDADTRRCRPIAAAEGAMAAGKRRAGPGPCRCPNRGGGQNQAGCALLANVGLFAANVADKKPMVHAGAHSSVMQATYGGKAYDAHQAQEHFVRLRAGAPIVEWFAKEVAGRKCVDVHMLKLDVEGCEFSALRGLEPLFAEHRIHFVFMEFWPVALMALGTDPVGILKWLAHYGFLCRFLGAAWGPESFEAFIARHTTPRTMLDLQNNHMSFQDLLCEDIYWSEPCPS